MVKLWAHSTYQSGMVIPYMMWNDMRPDLMRYRELGMCQLSPFMLNHGAPIEDIEDEEPTTATSEALDSTDEVQLGEDTDQGASVEEEEELPQPQTDDAIEDTVVEVEQPEYNFIKVETV